MTTSASEAVVVKTSSFRGRQICVGYRRAFTMLHSSRHVLSSRDKRASCNATSTNVAGEMETAGAWSGDAHAPRLRASSSAPAEIYPLSRTASILVPLRSRQAGLASRARRRCGPVILEPALLSSMFHDQRARRVCVVVASTATLYPVNSLGQNHEARQRYNSGTCETSKGHNIPGIASFCGDNDSGHDHGGRDHCHDPLVFCPKGYFSSQ